MKEELIKIEIDAAHYLALWKFSSEKSNSNQHVLLAHGTFSNRKVFNGIVTFLNEKGYTCWVFEWRNHGDSSKINDFFNFETIGKEDFKLVFDYLFNTQKIKQLDCITHSGGGLCLTMCLINHPSFKTKINSISMFACQGFGAADSIKNYIGIWTGKYLSKLLGYVPARKVGSAENESYYCMKQWFDWNLTGTFYGENGIDYRKEMRLIQIPVLSIYGSGDKFIAPPKGCESFLDSFKNPINQRLFCAKQNGFLEDYNHSRILHSRNASQEIYPKVWNFIKNYAPKTGQ